MTYNVNYTDKTKQPIIIADGDENNTSLDVSLFGRIKLEYGQQLNEDVLHLLENFALPASVGGSIANSVPRLSSTYNGILTHPTVGQLWFNDTQKRLYFWDGSAWRPLSNRGDYAANWGVLADGYRIPLPVGSNGYEFTYSECIWSVSPANFNTRFDSMVCSTDDGGLLTMKYRPAGGTDYVSSVANYLIIGIRGNVNHGMNVTPGLISPTPTPTHLTTQPVTPTPTRSPAIAVSPSNTSTPTVTPTRTQTPTPSHTQSVGATPAGTPPVTPTKTPTKTPTRTPTRTPAPSPTPTPPITPAPTQSPAALISARFFNANNTVQTLTSIDSFCNIAVHATGDNGYSCSGTLQTCPPNSCAVEPGDTAAGPELQMTVTGGTAPYNIKFTNWVGNFDPARANCIIAQSGGVTPINSNSSGVVNSTLSVNKTISTSGGQMANTLYLTGPCGTDEYNGSGTVDVIITDSLNNSKTYTLSWSVSRYNSNH